MLVAALAFVMDLLDSTIVNIAIPSIKANLGASYSAIQWVVAAYSLAFALLLVTGGRMGDVFGYKKIFAIGVAGFTIASFMSGIATGPMTLIVARFLQGSMAALMVPQVLSLVQVMYKPEERGAINGMFGALGGLAASLGPVLGGLLIKANWFGWDWRPIFLINVPVGIFGLFAAIKYLPDGKSPHPLKLDITGTAIIMTALLLLVYPLIQGRELGWPTWSFVMMIASLPVFGLFVYWQQRKERADASPLVLPSLFKRRSFTFGLTINLVFELAMIAFFLTFGLLLQIGFGFSPIHAALTGLPTAFGIAMTMALLGEKVIPKFGGRAINIGTAIMAAGLAICAWTAHHYVIGLHSWQLIPGLITTGVGMGFVFASLFPAVLSGVDVKHAGSVSGLLNAVQQVGGAIGIAVIGVIFFGQLSHAAPRSFASIEPELRTQLTAQHVPSSTQAVVIQGIEQCFIDRTREKDSSITPASCQQGDTMMSATLNQAITKDALQANTVNFDNAFRWAVISELGLLVVTFLLAFFLPRHFNAEAYEMAA